MARCPFARWLGPIPNMTPNGMFAYRGLILHIQEGTEAGTDAWFHNPKAQASAHFGNPKVGPLDQWVDTKDKAWAEASGNPYWISVENEGKSGDSLTPSQVENLAQLMVWLHDTHGVPIQVTDRIEGSGLGWHGMGAAAWGGHVSCPGTPIVNQRGVIVVRALQLIGKGNGTAPVAAAVTPIPTEEDPVLIVWHANSAYLLAQGRLSYIAGPTDLAAFKAKGAVELPAITDAEFGILSRAYGVDGKPVV